MSSVFFIIGNPRSGTSLFRLMLNAHPNIVVPPECGFMLWWKDKYIKENFENPHIKDVFYKDFVKSKKIETWNLNLETLYTKLVNSKLRTYGEACVRVYEIYAEQFDKKIKFVGDKNNYYIHFIKELSEIFPTAKFIHLIRDGRDVAASYLDLAHKKLKVKYAPDLPDNINDIAAEWSKNIKTIEADIEKYAEDGNITIKYEDLVTQPGKELVKVCDFLGCNFSPDMLRYNEKEYLPMHEPVEFLNWKSKTLQSPDASGISRYKKILSEEEIVKFNRVSFEILSKYDYI